MRKAVSESPLTLVVSVIVIFFIVSIGYFEIDAFITNRDKQVFVNDINNIRSSIEYLVSTNSLGSFNQVTLHLPVNQSVVFNNETEEIELNGYYNIVYDSSVDIVYMLNLSDSGTYELTLCYDCSTIKEYLVVFR